MYLRLLNGLKYGKKVLKTLQIEKQWNEFTPRYNTFDLCPQTFFYTLCSMMQIPQSRSILEVGCGTGKLLPFLISIKSSQTCYTGIDLSQKMIKQCHRNFEQNYKKYGLNHLTEQLLSKLKVSFLVGDIQNITLGYKFDRIICNCCLMIMQNPKKALGKMWQYMDQGGLLGVSVWGNKQNNNFMEATKSAILEAGFQLPNQRSFFHLYGKVTSMAAECGWQTILKWEQNAPFPVLSADFKKYYNLFGQTIRKLPIEQQQPVRDRLQHKIKNIINNGKPLNFSCQMYILRKK